MSDINEVRERLELAFAINGTGQAKRDVAALLADHARLAEEVQQIATHAELLKAPAIDLERFRCLADFVLDRSANTGNIKAAYDLRALIDRQANARSSSEQCSEAVGKGGVK